MKFDPRKRFRTVFLPLFAVFLFSSFLPLSPGDSSSAPAPKSAGIYKIKTVVIDAGHGGHDAGARGEFSSEKWVTLQLALRVQKLLQREMKDLNVVLTRNTDTFVELKKRAEIASQNQGDLFVSIHCNSLAPRRVKVGRGYRLVPNTSGRGPMILVYGLHRQSEQEEALRENAVILKEKDYKENYDGYDPNNPESMIVLGLVSNSYRKQSIKFANLVYNEFTETDGRSGLGVKEQGVLVLARASMPAVLVETGFINNPEEEKYLNSDEGQDEISASIMRAIASYRKEYETE
ncbi:MAG: N-acetylmuramoyl-L-alanine amidase [Mucilaginibacter polytrichastri]|nr:N-acetylmuramoyl-L-alanine amidase [Mucilaginibacter polytrichastri]